jgi:ribosomal protein S12 methylthiotransferase
MGEVPDLEVAGERRHELMTAQRGIVDVKMQSLLGQEAVVLVESQHPEEQSIMIGRSERHAPEIDGDVFVKGSVDQDIGKFIKVRYIEQLDYDLLGEKV